MLKKNQKVYVVQEDNQGLLTVVEGRFVKYEHESRDPYVRIPIEGDGLLDPIVVDCKEKEYFLKRPDALWAAAQKCLVSSGRWQARSWELLEELLREADPKPRARKRE